MLFRRGNLGLAGRILAILLLTVAIEFGVSTVLYERASETLVREDEARRLAEHLVIARKLVTERPWRERLALSGELTTDRYLVHWQVERPTPPRLAPELGEMRRQIVAWEPSLASSRLGLRLASLGRDASVDGELALADGSWLHFAMPQGAHRWDLAIGRIMLALVPAMALLVIGGLLIRRTLHPLTRLVSATERVGLDDQVVLAEEGTAEVRRLIHAFNAMQQRIHRLIGERTQALAAVGHDLRTPLARIKLRIEQPDILAADVALAGDVAEMDAMIGSLLAFLAGDDDPEPPMLCDLAVLAATCADRYQDAGQDVAYRGPDHLACMIRQGAIRRALTNLVDNALHYGGGATIVLEHGPGGLLLAVEDDGPGIPPGRLDDALRPFVRLDPARGRNTGGFGLGLAIVARTAEREGGSFRLTNRPEGGLRAELLLPSDTIPHKPAAA